MTNPHKGDVAFNVSGKTYTLRYSHSALVKLEKQLDKGLMKVMQDMTNPDQMRIGTVVALLWSGLQKHHPDMTFEDAADLLDDLEGGTSGAISVIDQAFGKAFSAPGTKGTNPQQKNQNGTGMQSSSSIAASDTILPISGTLPQEN
jgi:Phage tail tube protein, GTA-gp10